MTITLEQIDELRKRANVSFEDARDALEKCDGDLVQALVYLEKNGKIKSTAACEPKESLWDKFKALVKRGNNTRFIIWKKERTILNLSVTLSIIIAILAFHISVIGLLIALILGFRFKFEKSNGEGLKVNETFDKMHEDMENIKKKFAVDVLNKECTTKQ
jgi:hypothetical protein